MKVRDVLPVVLMFCCACAHAEAMLSIYGALGLAVRCKSNATPQGASRCGIGATPNAYGDLGLWGIEDLGSGWQAHFNIEMAFEPDNGSLSYADTLFGREASVSLVTPIGRFDAGRLHTLGTAAEPLVRADPTGGGGSYLETLWPGLNTGNRFNNAIRYRYKQGSVFGHALMGIGELGTLRSTVGRTVGAAIGYADGPAYVVAAYQNNHDKNDRVNEVASIGGHYTFERFTLHGAYLHAKREQGFMIGAYGEPLAASGLGLGANVPSVGGFSTDFVLVGITYPIKPMLILRGALFYAESRDGTLIATEGGVQRSAYAVLDYALSKRTFVEAGVDWNRWTGGWSGFWGSSAESGVAGPGNPFRNGFSTRTSISLGLRHDF